MLAAFALRKRRLGLTANANFATRLRRSTRLGARALTANAGGSLGTDAARAFIARSERVKEAQAGDTHDMAPMEAAE